MSNRRRSILATLGSLTAVLWLVTGCGRAQPSADVIATFRQGSVERLDVERLLSTQGGMTASGEAASPSEQYRRAAERLAIRQIILRRAGAADGADTDQLQRIRRQVTLDMLLESQLLTTPPVRPESVEEFYQQHHDRFHRAAQRRVWHIFRRHRDGESPDQTVALLRSLKQRAEAGETFQQLARDYSDSETRLFGGRLGWVGKGRLAKKLEGVVFELAEKAISEPVSVPGGATIFWVSEVVTEASYPLEDVRLAIQQHLARTGLRQQLLADKVGDRPLPEESMVLADEALKVALSGPADEVILEIADLRLTTADFRQLLEGAEQRNTHPWRPSFEEQVQAVYQGQIEDQRLYLAALDEGFPAQAKARLAFESRLNALLEDQRIDAWVERQILDRIDGDEEKLQRFFDDNAFLYQRPFQLELQILSVPAATDGAAEMAVLERLRGELAAGTTSFEQVAAELNGTVTDVGWVGAARLQAFEPKVRFYILELGSVGYTIPFQLNRQLSLVWVRNRREPEALPFTAVETRVRGDYFDRHRQRLYRELVADLLDAERFAYLGLPAGPG